MLLGSCPQQPDGIPDNRADASTQQPDGIPDNRADASRNVLALGMGYMRLNDRDRPVKADCPYFRDTRRIEKFEELGYHVHSVNMQLDPKESVGWPNHPRHVKLTWTGGSRAARNNVDQFLGEKFSIVTLDYFRFPSYYMKEAYPVTLFTNFLARGLLPHGILTEDFVVYVPNNTPMQDTVKQLKGLYTMTPVAREDNPLWQATDVLYRSGYEDGANYDHSEQIGETYDQAFPFLRLVAKISP